MYREINNMRTELFLSCLEHTAIILQINVCMCIYIYVCVCVFVSYRDIKRHSRFEEFGCSFEVDGIR